MSDDVDPGAAQSSPSPTADEVEGYGGTLVEAFSEGLMEAPEPMPWNSWEAWRSTVGRKPASR